MKEKLRRKGNLLILLKFSAILLWCCLPINAFAQQREVTGTVIDSENREPIPGVSIRIENTTTGTITDIDGNYSINVNSADAKLIFSFIGFESKTVVVGNQKKYRC